MESVSRAHSIRQIVWFVWARIVLPMAKNAKKGCKPLVTYTRPTGTFLESSLKGPKDHNIYLKWHTQRIKSLKNSAFFVFYQSLVVLGIHHQRVNYFKTVKASTTRRSLCGDHKMLSPFNDKLSALSSFRHRVGGTYGMGVCPGQAPIAIDWFCLLRVKVVPSEEDSPSCGVLVDIFQSVNAIRSAIYAFLSKSPHRQFLKIKAVVRINSAQQVT